MVLINRGIIGSNDGPFLHVFGITIDLEENVNYPISNSDLQVSTIQ